MQINVTHELLPREPSTNTSLVMDHFGLDRAPSRFVIAEGLDLPLESGDVASFTGPSGSGKSSLLRAVADQLEQVVWCDPRPSSPRAVIDALDLPTDEALRLLAQCGLGEARLMLRTPDELSDGQRYRFGLAQAFARRPRWIVADEFAAVLDRTLAKVIAFNLQKVARREGIGCLLATTHEDLADDLQPDLEVRCTLDGPANIVRRGVKKKISASCTNFASRAAPSPIGRISLGGITAATTLALSGS